MSDPGWVEERDGKLVAVTPCDCRYEVVLDDARTGRWQTCPGCERRWLLYALGSGRAVWSEMSAGPPPGRARRGTRGIRRRR